jgi:hypothetical protein
MKCSAGESTESTAAARTITDDRWCRWARGLARHWAIIYRRTDLDADVDLDGGGDDGSWRARKGNLAHAAESFGLWTP